jgi:hypothetical protein
LPGPVMIKTKNKFNYRTIPSFQYGCLFLQL